MGLLLQGEPFMYCFSIVLNCGVDRQGVQSISRKALGAMLGCRYNIFVFKFWVLKALFIQFDICSLPSPSSRLAIQVILVFCVIIHVTVISVLALLRLFVCAIRIVACVLHVRKSISCPIIIVNLDLYVLVCDCFRF